MVGNTHGKLNLWGLTAEAQLALCGPDIGTSILSRMHLSKPQRALSKRCVSALLKIEKTNASVFKILKDFTTKLYSIKSLWLTVIKNLTAQYYYKNYNELLNPRSPLDRSAPQRTPLTALTLPCSNRSWPSAVCANEKR